MGPDRTDRSKFSGFGMKIGSGNPGSSVGTPGGLQLPKRAGAKPGKPASSVSAMFMESMDRDDEAASKPVGPSWGKLTPEAMQAQRKALELQAADPSVFQYDEVIDSAPQGDDSTAQKVRADVFEQKKRVGLSNAGTKRKLEAKYIQNVITATDRRKVEQQIVEDKLLQKDKDRNKDCQVFMTEAYKEEMKRRKKFEEELEAQELRDQMNAAEKQEHGRGFANFHSNMLKNGLASSRGKETVNELAPAREEVKKEEDDDKKDVKEEEKDEVDVKMEEADGESTADRGAKAEAKLEDESQQLSHGVADVQTSSSLGAQNEEHRAEKTMSARERFLARKAAKEAGTGE